MMEILDFIAALLDVVLSFGGGRVTVQDRYKMKKKVRELKRKEGARGRRVDAARSGR
ncbi:MAG TPA: hypothetical protein VNN08_00655 [Thermoanaerobaculia bacterium]|nr:hypothetical protein [Thermoanaerobaculia bacterium]